MSACTFFKSELFQHAAAGNLCIYCFHERINVVSRLSVAALFYLAKPFLTVLLMKGSDVHFILFRWAISRLVDIRVLSSVFLIVILGNLSLVGDLCMIRALLPFYPIEGESLAMLPKTAIQAIASTTYDESAT